MKKYEQRLRASKKVLIDLGFTEFRGLRVSSMLYDLVVKEDILANTITWEQLPVVLDVRLLDYDFIFDVEKDNQ